MSVDLHISNRSVSARDYRIDFLRGLALLTIFINHVRGNFYEKFTHKNFGLSDAAEIFVLLAGISAALAFYPRFSRGQYTDVTRKISGRVGTLYIWHIASTLMALSLFVFAGLLFQNPSLFKEIGIGLVKNNPGEGLVGIFVLGHQLGYFNILPMYMVLMIMLPAIMFLHSINRWLLIGTSVAVYLIAGLFHIDLPNYPDKGMWFFNPIAWQILYVAGFAGWLYVKEKGEIPYNRFVYMAAVAWLVIWALWVQLDWWGYWSYFRIDGNLGALWGFDKTFVSLPRLIHVLALVYVFIHSPLARMMKGLISADNPVVRIGRHALHLFCFGSVLAMVMLIIRIQVGGSILLDTVLIGAGIAMHVMLANYLSKTPSEAPVVANRAETTAV